MDWNELLGSLINLAYAILDLLVRVVVAGLSFLPVLLHMLLAALHVT